MSPETLAQKTRELQAEYPYMFEHPEAKENEVYLSSTLAEVAGAQVAIYKREGGLPSARPGEPYLDKLKGHKGEFRFCPIFVKLDEFITAVEGG